MVLVGVVVVVVVVSNVREEVWMKTQQKSRIVHSKSDW